MKKEKAHLQKRILSLMRDEDYRPAKQHQIAKRLNISNKDSRQLRHTLKKMKHKGLTTKIKGNRWALQSEEDLERGTIKVFPSGFGIVNTESGSPEEIHITHRKLNGAIDGDTVLVQLIASRGDKSKFRKGKRPMRQSGEVVLVEKHGKDIVPGLFVKKLSNWYVIPDNSNIGQDVKITGVDVDNAGHKDLVDHKVVAKLDPPAPKIGGPSQLTGRVVENLGRKDEPGVDVLSVARQYEIGDAFEQNIEQSVRQLSKSVSKKEVDKRKDLRNLLTVTIDPVDAKDFDDAVSLKREKNGDWVLFVHIADVAHYVDVDSAIDLEALSRGNSTYLVDRVMPMLPEHLTNDVCSLRPNVDSLTHTVEIKLNPKGEVVDSSTYRSAIHSDARLVYEQVQSFFDGQKDHGIDQKICDNLADMRKLALVLRKKRTREGSLDFSMPEVRCVLDKTGKCADIVKQGGSEACRVVEEFMLSANRVVARILYDDDREAIYRIHPEPDEDEWAGLVAELRVLGVDPLPHKFSDINNALAEMEGTPGKHAFNIRILRTMKKAMYSAESTGHFGLGFKYYTHFTSPIRRYPDLIVHRLLASIEGNDNSYRPSKGKLKKMAKHCSDTEIESQNAERESIEIKRIGYLQEQLWKGNSGPFSGVIVSIISKGLLVELDDTLQSGLIPFSSLKRDHFIVSDDGLVAKGRRTGKVWKVGQAVKVNLAKVDTERRLVDFEMA